jgi:hypothetical protein
VDQLIEKINQQYGGKASRFFGFDEQTRHCLCGMLDIALIS